MEDKEAENTCAPPKKMVTVACEEAGSTWRGCIDFFLNMQAYRATAGCV